jgi:hypothetical protein
MEEGVRNMRSIEYRYANDEFYRSWAGKITPIKFPSDWGVEMVGPFAGALARFKVNNKVSVYLDVDDSLGYMGEPYWEIYPDKFGDCSRYFMKETEDLVKGIQEALDEELNDH